MKAGRQRHPHSRPSIPWAPRLEAPIGQCIRLGKTVFGVLSRFALLEDVISFSSEEPAKVITNNLLVEPTGIEPVTYWLQTSRSPS